MEVILTVFVLTIIGIAILKSFGKYILKKKYDEYGYDKDGYDCDGYNKDGFNRAGYNVFGQTVGGKYNRLCDVENYCRSEYSRDGFLNPNIYHIAVTEHARQRISERVSVGKSIGAEELAAEAYCYGRSARQIKKTSAALVEDIQNRRGNGIVLIYRGYIFVFSEENVLITVYKNERIPL